MSCRQLNSGVLLVFALGFGAVSLSGQPVRSGSAAPATLTLDDLLHTAGPAWDEARTRHFVVYAERGRPRISARALGDSLEEGWRNAVSLIAIQPPDAPIVPVLVTHSAGRFPALLSPFSRALTTTPGPGKSAFIILVHNDSIRAYTRHEVMHVVASRALGVAASYWITEGVAVWADGRCQTTSVVNVARDFLARDPGLTVAALAEQFAERAQRNAAERARVYVLAGSLVSFVYDRNGAAGVWALWRQGIPASRDMALTADSITPAWRAWVKNRGDIGESLAPEKFERYACG
jgi:hypothetical protein